MKKIKEILPITDDVNLSVYTYQSYLDAIIANEHRIGEDAARINILNYEREAWNYISDSLDYVREGDGIVFKANKFNLNMNARLLRQLNIEDEIEVEVEYQQYSQAWGNVSLVISESEDSSSSFIIQFGEFNKSGYFFKLSDEKINGINIKHNKGDKYVLRREEKFLHLAIRKYEDMIQEEIIFEGEIDFNDKNNYQLGVAIDLFDNQYYDWLYSNHIQWKYSKLPSPVMFEFDVGIIRNWNYQSINFFLMYKIEEARTLFDLDIDVLDYICSEIGNKKYIEIILDSYDLIGTNEYGVRSFVHQCLLYGYDREKEVVFVLCTNAGKPFLTNISFENLKRQFSSMKEDTHLVSQKYDPQKNKINLTLEIVYDGLMRYMSGNPIMDFQLIAPQDEYYYGIRIYDMFKKNEGRELLLSDIRISHLILEHKKCMVERLEFMVAKKLLCQEEVEKISVDLKNILKCAHILRNLVIKLQRKYDERTINKILTRLKMIEILERRTYPQLLEVMGNKIK